MGHPITDISIAKGLFLSKVARLSATRRKTFASGVVDELKKLPLPSRIEGMILFNPTRVLGVLLNRRYGFPTI
jgi:hypothetical protein